MPDVTLYCVVHGPIYEAYADVLIPQARELVTTFGHGEHTCPAQPFSLAAMCRSAERLVLAYDLEPAPDFTAVTPLAVQIGGVARSQHPCEVRFRAR